jgi:hypothetical protein
MPAACAAATALLPSVCESARSVTPSLLKSPASRTMANGFPAENWNKLLSFLMQLSVNLPASS